MKIARKIAITVAAATMSVGLLGISAPAHAMDSGWGCGGCRSTHR